MPMKQLEYESMIITAAAFEVARSGRFVVSLSIARTSEQGVANRKLFDPPLPEVDGNRVAEALESTIDFGRAIVDGDVAGCTVKDL